MKLKPAKILFSRTALCGLFSLVMFSTLSQSGTKKNVENVFSNAIQLLPSKAIPTVDSTSFDSFIDEDDYKIVDTDALQLDRIFPAWNSEGYHFRAIHAYQIYLSHSFISIVVTVLKGDNEMESLLINYDPDGNMIDFEMVSYDEIAEGWTRYTSMIEKNLLTRTYYIWSSEDSFPIMEVSLLSINSDGTFSRE